MMKYVVIAKRYNEEKDGSEEYIAGEFPYLIGAKVFKKAYDSYFDSESEIYERTGNIEDLNKIDYSEYRRTSK